MSRDLRVGCGVIFGGVPATIVDLPDHANLVIKLANQAGVRHVPRADVIVVKEKADLLGKTNLSEIPDDIWDAASRRASALRGVIAAQSNRSLAVAKAANDLCISTRQVWRLVNQMEQHQSIVKLIPEKPGRKQGGRVLNLAVERLIASKIESFYLVPERPTIKELHDRIAVECRKDGLPVPHMRTVAERVAYCRDEKSIARRDGAKAAKYATQAMPGHVEADAPLSRVEIDHTPMDVMVRSDDPLCGYVGRPWLTLAIDVHTRIILGLLISFEPPSSLSVALCLTHVLLPKNPRDEFGVPLEWPMFGKPREIVVDNAKEFDSVALRRGCEEHGIILTYRPIGSPHFGGTIERLIGTMVGKCHLLPGTTKRSVAARGDYDSVKSAKMTLRELRGWFVEQVLGSYHVSNHRTLRIPPKTAWERAMGGSHD